MTRLPAAVAEMRAAILAAVDANDLAELRIAIEMNEMKPDFAGEPGVDPLDVLRKASIRRHGP